MATDIMVSVIIVTYNHQHCIGQALESVIKQKTDFKFEVIVGDDASQDGTGWIVEDYARRYPNVIVSVIRKKNLGPVRNMMDLSRRARGRYIAFLDGDDFWVNEQKLQKQYEFLEINFDYVAVFTKHFLVGKDGVRNHELEKWIPIFEGGEFEIADFEKYLLPGQTSSAFYRTHFVLKVIDKFHGLSGLGVALVPGDRVLVLAALGEGKIYTIPDVMVAYRYVLETESGTWSSKHDIYTYKTLLFFILQLGILEKLARHFKLKLSYDDRRIYEFRKVSENRNWKTSLMRLFIILQIRNKKRLVELIKK